MKTESPEIERGEQLTRGLSSGQLSMIAIGGAIGTGLFLGSSLAVNLAGNGVIFSYMIGAMIALLFMGALSEMAVAHPTAGSFGVYAELYLNPWAGFVIRYTYWAVQCIAIGGEAVAISIYCQFWFPHTPQWLWTAAFSIALLYVNARSVSSFGSFEYWFAMIKVVAIVVFIAFGLALLVGLGPVPAIGLANFTGNGGMLPKGIHGVWMAMVFVIFSYIGTEVVAVTAGEARDPERAVPKAMRSMVGRLIVFYLGAIAVLVAIVPWNQIQPGAHLTASPFVRVFQLTGIPAAAHVINFVVVTAAASSMNCNLYLTSRMMFSLSRGGYAPAMFGQVSRRGVPVNALLISGAGLATAILVAMLAPDSAFVYLFGVSLFGGLFVWLMVFITHLAFRPKWDALGLPRLPVRMIGYPFTSLLGAALLVAILITTWWVEGMRITLIAGIPWLGLITAAYFLVRANLAKAGSKTGVNAG
ncbi:MAG TPA: amino acid permease [Candidatus Acidoferrales bacterium]|jgi:AAT family amino acid transporter|nr:amino acid permease [Candidatus Acidoferrales bacterium]